MSTVDTLKETLRQLDVDNLSRRDVVDGSLVTLSWYIILRVKNHKDRWVEIKSVTLDQTGGSEDHLVTENKRKKDV